VLEELSFWSFAELQVTSWWTKCIHKLTRKNIHLQSFKLKTKDNSLTHLRARYPIDSYPLKVLIYQLSISLMST
jgi:hypothetical protein